MNWDAIGAIAELAGAIGVIVTVLFVALQVRQNSQIVINNTNQLEQNYELARSEAIKQSNAQQDSMLSIAQDGELSELFFRGLRSYVGLNETERMRFSLAMGPLIGSVSTQMEQQISLDILGDDSAPDHLYFVRGFLGTQGGTEWWTRNRKNYSKRFRSLVDVYLNEVHDT